MRKAGGRCGMGNGEGSVQPHPEPPVSELEGELPASNEELEPLPLSNDGLLLGAESNDEWLRPSGVEVG